METNKKKGPKKKKPYKEPVFRVVQMDYSDSTGTAGTSIIGVTTGLTASATPSS